MSFWFFETSNQNQTNVTFTSFQATAKKFKLNQKKRLKRT